jgi:hypothetical protein
MQTVSGIYANLLVQMTWLKCLPLAYTPQNWPPARQIRLSDLEKV